MAIRVGRLRRWCWHLRQRLLRRAICRVIWRLRRALAARKTCCPICSHAMRPKDSPVKFMLFVCSSCGHEKQLDFEFSWRETCVNGIRVLPQVKHQRDTDHCVFYAIAAALEAMLTFKMAEKGHNYHALISIDDMVTFTKFNGELAAYGLNDSQSGNFKFRSCEEMLTGSGVLTNRGKQKPEGLREDSDYVRIKESHWHKDISFEEACSLVLEGKMLITTVRSTEAFHSLEANDVYECTAFPEIAIDKIDPAPPAPPAREVWHALVIVGFGVEDGKNFFRVQNSHGSNWADHGFGKVRDNSVGKFLELCI